MSKSIKKYACGLAMIALAGVSHIASAATTVTTSKTFAVSYTVANKFSITKSGGHAIESNEPMALTGRPGAKATKNLALTFDSNLGNVYAKLSAANPKLTGPGSNNFIPLVVKIGSVGLTNVKQVVSGGGSASKELIIESADIIATDKVAGSYQAALEIEFTSEL